MMQVVDATAKRYKLLVIMPDLFHGHAWKANNFPPENEDELETWMEKYVDWITNVKNNLINLDNELHKRRCCTRIGIFGICWRGKVVTLAEVEIRGLKAVVLVHPASLENHEACGIKIPMYLMPSQEEPDMIPFNDLLKQKFGTNSGHYRFDEMNHGFAGAQGSFGDPANAQRVDEVINRLGRFFN